MVSSIENDYEQWVDSWTCELKNTSAGHSQLQWSQLLDRWLDQQWADAQTLLSQGRRVRTCKTCDPSSRVWERVGYRMLQRSIGARRALIDTLHGDILVDQKPLSPVSHSSTPRPKTRLTKPQTDHAYTALASSSEDELLAPLLVNIDSYPSAVTNAAIHVTSSSSSPQATRRSRHRLPTRLLAPSPSAPTFSTTCETVICRNHITRHCNMHWHAATETLNRDCEDTMVSLQDNCTLCHEPYLTAKHRSLPLDENPVAESDLTTSAASSIRSGTPTCVNELDTLAQQLDRMAINTVHCALPPLTDLRDDDDADDETTSSSVSSSSGKSPLVSSGNHRQEYRLPFTVQGIPSITRFLVPHQSPMC